MLTVDSTYQSAPFYVQRLVEETFGRIMAARKNDELPETERNPDIKPPRCKNIILMTGTSEPLSKVRLPVEDSKRLCSKVDKVGCEVTRLVE